MNFVPNCGKYTGLNLSGEFLLPGTPRTVLHTRVCYAPLGSNSNFYDCVVVSSNKCNVIVSI